MKKLWNVFVLTLALNFLGAAGGIGWLWNSGHLDRGRVTAIKAVLFPPPATRPATPEPSTQPGERPLVGLDDLLARHGAPRSAAEQVQTVQAAFDARMTQLDERQRQVEDLIRVAHQAQAKVEIDRQALELANKRLTQQQQDAARLASDKGFQDTLNLYNSMNGKQVKAVFLTLDDATVSQYLQAMDPRTASRVIKEFKTPDETARIRKIMEQIRLAGPATQESKEN